MTPKAFLFDLDGVLTDTAEYHYQAWKHLSDDLGIAFDRTINEQLKGVSREQSLQIILAHNHQETQYTEEQKKTFATQKNRIYQQLIQNITPDDLLPGIQAFLQQARQAGISLAVASASKNALAVLRSLQIADHFDYVADANKITHSKPHPEVFLDCARALSVPPIHCVGFEDAQAGIEAIKQAGMIAVGIGVSVTTVAPDLPYSSTEELDFDALVLKLLSY